MKTLIIGGGLSGLALADMLEARGHDYLLVEARDRFGGRILSEPVGGADFDLGPAWFWPGQPRIAALIQRFGLVAFDQFATGDLMFEDETGRVQRGRGFASMEGSYRMKGGLGRLIDALVGAVPEGRRRLGATVTSLSSNETGVTARLADGAALTADRIVLALPLRIAAEIETSPALPAVVLSVMRDTPTWMAGQAKAVAVYDNPFWREAGLSGDAMSRRGPMVEIHDASPAAGGPFGLFGFIGAPPGARADRDALRRQVLEQLQRLFGDQARAPMALLLKDWASEPATSTAADKAPLLTHPTYGLSQSLSGLWDGRLILGGTETAPQFGGYLEGALEAAEAVFAALDR